VKPRVDDVAGDICWSLPRLPRLRFDSYVGEGGFHGAADLNVAAQVEIESRV